jgi:hypothetical protein
MSRTSKIEHVVILKSKFDLDDRRVFFGQARLMPDRIVLKGLFYKRMIALSTIKEVRWSSNLIVLGLDDGDEVDLIIQSAALWKYELQARCGLTDNISTFEDLKSPSLGTDNAKLNEGSASDATGDASTTQVPTVSPGRESSYRIKSQFAQDRPQKD